MPFELKIDAARRMVHSRVWGKFTSDDVVHHRELLEAAPEFDGTFRQFVDFQEVTHFEVTVPAMRSFAHADPWSADARRAFVATTDLVFGMARMYEMLMEPTTSNIAVFRRAEEARNWLSCHE